MTAYDLERDTPCACGHPRWMHDLWGCLLGSAPNGGWCRCPRFRECELPSSPGESVGTEAQRVANGVDSRGGTQPERQRTGEAPDRADESAEIRAIEGGGAGDRRGGCEPPASPGVLTVISVGDPPEPEGQLYQDLVDWSRQQLLRGGGRS